MTLREIESANTENQGKALRLFVELLAFLRLSRP